MSTPTLQQIPLNQIHAKDNYRKTFKDKSLKELAQSIKKNGVIEPIIVRPNDTGFEIIAGERRFRASEIAGQVTIPAIIQKASAQGTVFSVKEKVRNGKPVFEVMTAQGNTTKTTFYDLMTGEPAAG